MPIDIVMAGIAVADFDAAVPWYERLLGRGADDLPMDGLAEWRLRETGGIQVIHDANRAGSALLTLSVDDLEAHVAGLEERGLTPSAIDDKTSDKVLIATIADPEGNAITLVEQRSSQQHEMGLSAYKVRTSIAVSDIARAAEFYEARLGLPTGDVQSDESRIYACRGDTALHVYESPAYAGRGTATLATWYVEDLERVVDELDSRGVTFQRYDDPVLKTDAKGIHELGDGRVAWFSDPDGNAFAIEERSAR